jgi:LemA protein
MNKWAILGGLALLIFVLGSFFIGSYNNFVTLEQKIDGQWAQVETQYQRRFDLIPNLVNSVKAVLEQEQKVFGDIAEARTRYSGASNTDEKAAAATELEGALSRLLVIVENYPQLKSNETVQRLMDELAGTENRIAVERQRYNTVVQDYNTQVSRFPGNVLGGMFGFQKKTYFESKEAAAEPPTVDLTQ